MSDRTKPIPMEKKLELAQVIREENMGNRMRIKKREQILYGTDKMLPLWEKNRGNVMENSLDEQTEALNQSPSTFKLRMIMAVVLFAAFLLCDAGNYKLFGYSMNDISKMLSEDSLQLENPMEEKDMMTQLSSMLHLDFEK